MRIAILSDIHDNVWNLAEALKQVADTDTMICCGDLCSPFIVAQLANGYAGPIHVVFGNNDADLYRITQIAGNFEHVNLHGEFLKTELAGKRFAVNHFDNIALEMAGTEAADVVCYGHNHVHKIERIGKTLTINPGPIMGYNPGAKQRVPATFVVYDTLTDQATTGEA